MIKAVIVGAVHTHAHTHTHTHTHTQYLSIKKKKNLIVYIRNLKLKIIKKSKNFKEKYFGKIRYIIRNKGYPLII